MRTKVVGSVVFLLLASFTAAFADSPLRTFVIGKLVYSPLNSVGMTNTEIVDTSTWNIYNDTNYGFSFKYPSDLRIISDSTDTDAKGQVKNLLLASGNGKEQISILVRNADQADLLTYGLKVESQSKIDVDGLNVTDYSASLTANTSNGTYTGVVNFAVFEMGTYAYKATISPDIMYTVLSTFHQLP